MANTLSNAAVKELQGLKQYIDRQIRNLSGGGDHITQGHSRKVRIGVTVSNKFPYPPSGDTFEVAFGDPDFDNTSVGDKELDFTKYRPEADEIRICHSINGEYYAEGTYVYLMHVNQKWYIVDSGGGGHEIIIFELLGDEYAEEAYSELCEDKLEDAEMSYEAAVLYRPCGVTRVTEETEGGTVVVHDDMGTWLANREAAEVGGRVGVAIYVQTEDYSACHWSIIFLDWWREVQVISNVILTPDELKFEVKNVVVWDDCDLDPIIIPLTDCVEEY